MRKTQNGLILIRGNIPKWIGQVLSLFLIWEGYTGPCWVGLCILTASVLPVEAFSIKPLGTKSGETIMHFEIPTLFKIWYPAASKIATERFSTPVHERATNIIYGCDDAATDCSPGGSSIPYAPLAILAGNQWNDNPPFELISTDTPYCKNYVGTTIKAPYFIECWYTLFRDGEKKSEQGDFFDANSGNVLLYRVHFGDMQFLHSMGSKDGEEVRITKEHIMMWAEFTYKVATGQLGRGIALNQTGIPGMGKLFWNRGWTAQQLFIRGDGTFHREKDFRAFVFGSFLHLVQDSFSASHVDRDEPDGTQCPGTSGLYKPGKIRNFHSYPHQDKSKHKRQDSHDALSAKLAEVPPTVKDIGIALRTYYGGNRPWEDVKQYLECVYELEDPMAKAGAGDGFLLD
jgi:hypothetical protein